MHAQQTHEAEGEEKRWIDPMLLACGFPLLLLGHTLASFDLPPGWLSLHSDSIISSTFCE